jgi:hypothetical protein
MHPTALVALAAPSRSAAARMQRSPSTESHATVNKPSGARRALRMAAVLAGSFVLVISLVDPLRGSDQSGAYDATQEQGARNE